MILAVADWVWLGLYRLFEVDPIGPIAAGLAIAAVLRVRHRVDERLGRAERFAWESPKPVGEVIADLLVAAGIESVRVEPVRGPMANYYDPASGTLRLAPEVFESRSLAGLGLGSHEVGHALRQARGDSPLLLFARDGLAQMAALAPGLLATAAAVGFVLEISWLLTGGLIGFAAALLLPLIGLPMEREASRRADRALGMSAILDSDATEVVRGVLAAADLTTFVSTLPRIRGRGRRT